MSRKMRKLHTGTYGLVDSRRWKYLRVFETHETSTGATRIVERRIAKLPWDFLERITFGDRLFDMLYTKYRERRYRPVGVRETMKLIRMRDVTKALTGK